MKLVNTVSIAALGLLSLAASAFAATSDNAAVDLDATARKQWRDYVAKNPAPVEGCAHLTYPNYAWEHVDCKATQTRAQPSRRVDPTDPIPDVVGNGNDYIIQTQSLINFIYADFQNSTGITSEKSVGVALFNDEGKLGANEYTIQINTNNDRSTAACDGHTGCTVWQQFIYATDYYAEGEGALYMQYWMYNWSAVCPKGWYPNDGKTHTNCYENSKLLELPNIPVTDLPNVAMSAHATTGGNDLLQLIDGNEGWILTTSDSVLDIGEVWYQAEFNVVGDGGGSEAIFNAGATINAQVAIADGSNSVPTCVAGIATTGETNNMYLGSCQAGIFIDPLILFSEHTLAVAPLPPGIPPIKPIL